MKQYLTADDIVAEVEMVRTQFKGTVLLLEGDTDCRLLDQLIDSPLCRTLPGHGKQRVLEAVSKLEAVNFKGILAIVDSDFWRVLGRHSPSPNVIMTDHHDLEIMLLRSRAIDKVLSEFSSDNKVATYLNERDNDDLVSALLEASLPLAVLRFISIRDSLSLKFEGVEIESYTNLKTLDVDFPSILSRVLQITGDPSIDISALNEEIKTALKRDHDLDQMCNGHDAVGLLSHGLRRALGSCSAAVASADNVGRMLRMAFELRDLQETTLYLEVRAWEARNVPFQVFAA